MKTLPMIIAVAAILLAGCASTHAVHLDADNPSYAEINKLGAKKEARVTLTNGQWFNVRSLQVTPDSASWINYGSYLEAVATTQLRTIRFGSDSPEPMLAIALLGLGAALGAIIGETEEEIYHPASEGFYFFGLSFPSRPAYTETVKHVRPGFVVVGTALGAFASWMIFRSNKQSSFLFRVPTPSSDPPIATTYYPPHRKAALVSHRKK